MQPGSSDHAVAPVVVAVPAPAVVPIAVVETKPFYKTSEFWYLAASGLEVFLENLMSGGISRASMLNAGMAAAYALARGVAKSGNPVAKVETPQRIVEPR
jgi:hypothetical protein